MPRKDAPMKTFRMLVCEPATVPEQMDGVQQGNNILYLLPPKLATLDTTKPEYEFYQQLVEEQLLTYRLYGETWREKVTGCPMVRRDFDKQPHGPFIVCVDTSGSMGGFNERCTKASCLVLMHVTLTDNRRCFTMLFSTKIMHYEPSGPKGIEWVARFLSQRFCGDADIASCFRAIIERIQGREWLGTDAVIISDFITQWLSDEIVSRVEELQRVRQRRFHAVTMSAYDRPDIIRIFGHIWRLDAGMQGCPFKHWRC